MSAGDASLPTAGRVEGRLAPRAYQPGDPLPKVGSQCLVSGANCDVDSDQHRSYSWRQVLGYSGDDQFICLQTDGCWPTVERTTSCWFAEVPMPRAALSASERAQEPVATLKCWEEPRYDKPPRAFYELKLTDAGNALPPGEYTLFAAPSPLIEEKKA